MIGKVFAERYEILEKIGSGGMGDVFKAHDRKLDRIVAIKVLKSQYSEDENFIRKFKRESLAAASISHPNIVSIYDVGTETINNEIDHYIVMEYIDGKTLKEIISEDGKLYQNRALNYTIQIAEALKIAHLKGIVHRDIKAQNIMITRDDRVKVTDFGIARIADNATATATSAVMGSVHYFSPEQARGGKIDRRSDIYSLGIVLFEMLTGQLPFDAENPITIALMHVQNKMLSPSELNPSITAVVDSLVTKMTMKAVNERYDNVSEVIKDIKDILLNRATVSSMKSKNTIPLEKTKATNNRDKNVKERIPKKIDREKIEKPKKNSSKSSAGALFGVFLAILIFVAALWGVPKLISKNPEPTEDLIKSPKLVGLSLDEASAQAEIDGVKINIIDYETNDEKDDNIVLKQDPKEGKEIEKGSSIGIVINQKSELIAVPDLSNKKAEEVEAIIKKYKLTLGEIKKDYSDTVEENHVISQIPEKGEKVLPDSKVYVTISQGKKKENIPVPALRGETVEKATALLEEVGLVRGTVREETSNSVGVGEVTWQSFPAGVIVQSGTAVDIKISSGKGETIPPDDNASENIVSRTEKISVPSDGKAHSVRVTKKVGSSEEVVREFILNASEEATVDLNGYVGDVFTIEVDMEKVNTIILK